MKYRHNALIKQTIASYHLYDRVQLRYILDGVCMYNVAHLDSSPALSRSAVTYIVLSSTSSGGNERWDVWSWLSQGR